MKVLISLKEKPYWSQLNKLGRLVELVRGWDRGLYYIRVCIVLDDDKGQNMAMVMAEDEHRKNGHWR